MKKSSCGCQKSGRYNHSPKVMHVYEVLLDKGKDGHSNNRTKIWEVELTCNEGWDGQRKCVWSMDIYRQAKALPPSEHVKREGKKKMSFLKISKEEHYIWKNINHKQKWYQV